MTYEDVQAKDYRKFQTEHADRLVVGGAPCTYFYAPDYRKITDKEVREALVWAIPYKDTIIASGLIPDVNAIPATQPHAAGHPRSRGVQPAAGPPGRARPTRRRPSRSSQDSGNLGYEIKFLWRTDNDTDVKAQGRPGEGARGGRLQGDPDRRPRRRSTPPSVTTSRTTSTSAPPAGARTGRRARPGSRRCSSHRHRRARLGTNYEAFSEPTSTEDQGRVAGDAGRRAAGRLGATWRRRS